MSKIAVGDLVKCVDARFNLENEKIYKVTNLTLDYRGEPFYLYLEGFETYGFYASRFEKIEMPLLSREEWITNFTYLSTPQIVDKLIELELIKVRPSTAKEVFIETAMEDYGYSSPGTSGFLDELDAIMKKCNVDFKFKDE